MARIKNNLSKNENCRDSLWIHAVSVGEVLSLQNLISQMKRKHPEWEVNLSTLTPTGFKIAHQKINQADRIFYLPLDFSWVVKKYFNQLNPKVFILTESEFWPNLLREAKKRKKGVLLINGRISDRSFKRYYLFRFIFKRVLQNIDLFLVQSLRDKEKLEKTGVDSKKIIISGNLKADIELPDFSEEDILQFKAELGINHRGKIIVAGSTFKGEEEKIFRAFVRSRERRKELLLILAPRHPERFNEVEKLAQKFSFRLTRKTRLKKEEGWDILILDTLGELTRFYALADAAFVGGSLVPRGGHNILEPAYYQKPIFFGPYMNNFQDLAQRFLEEEGARVVRNEDDLVEMMINAGSEKFRQMGRIARKTLISLQGATQNSLTAIESFMKNSSK